MNGYNPYSQYSYMNYAYPTFGNRQYVQQQGQAQPTQPIMPSLCYAKMEEAKPYIITAPNSSMLFIDREKGMALLKSSDNVYNTYSQYFNFVETDENGNPLQLKPQENTEKIDFSQFVTKKEIDALPTAEQYKQLTEQYNSLVEQFKTMQKIIVGGKPNGNGTNTAKGN
jgi:hypothetical protein